MISCNNVVVVVDDPISGAEGISPVELFLVKPFQIVCSSWIPSAPEEDCVMISILNCINHGAAPVILLVVFSWAPLPVFVGAAAGRNLAGVPCGKSFSRSKHARIMGGTAANIVDFPYAISLQTARGEHFCGGSLVSKIHQGRTKIVV